MRCAALNNDCIRCRSHKTKLYYYHGDEMYSMSKEPTSLAVRLCRKHAVGSEYSEKKAVAEAKQWHKRRREAGLVEHETSNLR